jgi:hypothetical protein
MTDKMDMGHVEDFLSHPATGAGLTTVEVKTQVRVTAEQADAYKALPADLKAKLGPPVYGQVMSAKAMKELVKGTVSSTIMCPW